MPALLSLSLPTVPSVLDSLLEGFDPPFQLTELIHSGKLSSELAGFLQRQPSIVRLGWYSLLVDEQPAYLSKLLENELFLPALNELAGPLPLLSVVIPRRFITKIQVMYHTLAFLRLEGSMAAFSHPMGRLSSLCIVEHRPSWQGCMTLICNLKATHARHTLKDIHIVEAFMGPSAVHQQNAFRAHVARLVGFGSLEYVKISQAPGTKPQTRAVYEQLIISGMDRISSWRMIIPSLVSVDVYDCRVPQ
ncbi:hypothetical protein RSOLAG1IB_12280 [Rhizoctonia solani AG-1 IB]|uniref:Uncharacterized protein n=1 Tax=Thanatephorus cucumeris (strain AG1-IB / isolate 7/3/14) TaxID=1108050 RepID=A0A0B7FUN3_THACB|nr:hypothetical protein RSOLAG1IB_12280 [Rhizoctonia solani AG-1 IB]